VFESHPLTILSAPSASSCISSRALFLGARVCGDWTRALNLYAKEGADPLSKEGKEAGENPGTQVQVMLDGPYGGCSVDLGRYESVLLVSGGSGATFAIGLLDDIVGRCVKLGRRGGERTKRIEFAWCTRSFGKFPRDVIANVDRESFAGSIAWFESQLMDIATAAAGSAIDLHLSIFVTCLCNPENVPPIPNLDVTIHRPSVTTILQDLLFPSLLREEDSEEGITTRPEKEKDDGTPNPWVPTGGGVAVCASGPETMTREAQNAVARMAMTKGVELGGIALHTELFSM
jgi:ferric-chelate reductase